MPETGNDPAFRHFVLAAVGQIVRHPLNSLGAMLIIPTIGGGIVVVMLVQQIRFSRNLSRRPGHDRSTIS